MAESRQVGGVSMNGERNGRVPESLWTGEDAARFLKVSLKTVRRLVYWQNLPCVRIGSRLRFVPADVLAWARRKEE